MMMMATTFVMLQTPALGLAQAGIIRRKNALSMLMQTLTGFVLGSLLWFFVGFSLTFSHSVGDAGVIGDLQNMFFDGVSTIHCYPNSGGKIYSRNFVCRISNDVCRDGSCYSDGCMGRADAV